MQQIFMFIPFLKLLIADSDSGEIARIEKILQANKIQYRLQSLTSRGTLGRTYDAMNLNRMNLGQGKAAYNLGVNYLIYVRKKDWDLANRLIG